MKYMLLIYGAEDSWTEEEREACMVESMGIGDELSARGKYLDSSPLEPAATAATVRVRDGRAMVTDGPFAETTEQLGGFYILELEDLDEAIAVASRLPPAKKGTVEIRPVLELDGLPPSRPLPGGPAEAGSGRPFMLLCYDDEGAWTSAGEEAHRAAMAEASALARELSEAGRYVSASPLHPTELATSVRVRDGLRQVTDGPFAETNEVLGGYYVIMARSRDEAVQVASRHPGARFGSVEVRPIFDLSALRGAAPIS
ncbi:YCII-related domain protein [Tautonia plasticadhaerens]|uniref:YCII-related domain protein n=2 Tax=Tautonia plasticadhaerens TaxID=2527974 RepID=A0A518HB76_9BACT|nr:YCII-related domain protein [Tautonia plasticadhaerens]